MKGYVKHELPSAVPDREGAHHHLLVVEPGPWTAPSWAVIPTSGNPNRAGGICAVPDCQTEYYNRVPNTEIGLCQPHWFQWYRSEHTQVIEWLPHAKRPQSRTRANAVHLRVIDFTALPPLVALEIRYTVGRKVTLGDWTPNRCLLEFLTSLVAAVGDTDCLSLLDRSPDEWGTLVIERSIRSSRNNAKAYTRTFFSTLHRALVLDPWAEPKWLWKNTMDRLVHKQLQIPHNTNIDWSKVTQDWLREPVKAHAKEQLITGKRAWATILTWSKALSRLSSFLEQEGVDEPALLDRDVFLDYIAWSNENGASKHVLSGVNVAAAVLSAVQDEPRRQRAEGDESAEPVFGSEVFLRFGENVVEKTRRPKPYPADIVERIDREVLRDPDLEPTARCMLQLTRWGGLRISELVQTPIDSLRHNGKNGYWMSYYMPKTKRNREFPIPNDLAEELLAQQQRVRELYGTDASLLFPSPKQSNPNRGTTRPWSVTGFRKHIATSFRRNGITQSSVTGEQIRGSEIHRYRHTIGTALLNSGWSQREVKEFLGHESETMTASYAEILDETLVRKINDFHESQASTTPDPDQPQSHPGVERLRNRFAFVLADGTCALPANQHCDIRDNPCSDCVFYDPSGDDIRPVHENRRRRLKLHIENNDDPAEVALNEKALRATERALDDQGGAA
ncbi:tyrosine-type recombinase/integrase [Mycolicibacterium senegalense]|uniref:tyrosine-type recombinase/integrase n=1 Tax=Mycolicibacterium senegalense TaxID=1796 RepID=UPI003637393A